MRSGDIILKGYEEFIKNNQKFRDKLPTIVSRTINLSAKQYHRKAVSEIRKIYNFPKVRLKLQTGMATKRKKVAMVWATPSLLQATLRTMTRPQNLIEFSNGTGFLNYKLARQKAQNAKGVKVKVYKRGGFNLIKHAFIAPGTHSGKPLVYWRVEGSSDINKHRSAIRPKTRLVGRYPIKALYGVSITQMFTNPVVEANAEIYYKKQFDKNIINKSKAFM